MRTTQWPVTAPLFGSQPRRLSCVCSGLEPHSRTSRCARPQPTPSPRYCSPTQLLRTATAVLLTAAPDHCGPPGPVVSPVAVLQQPWLRNSTTAPSCELQLHYCCPAVRVCQALLSFWATRETITVPLPDVYSHQHRFSRVGGEVCLQRRCEAVAGRSPGKGPGRRGAPTATGSGDRRRAGQGRRPDRCGP